MEETTIIIGDSLTNDFFDPGFSHVKVNVGKPEIDRLMGSDESYGNGPLPSYMQEAARVGISNNIHTILLRDLHDPEDNKQQVELMRYGRHNIEGTPGAEFIDPIQSIVPASSVINTQTLAMPMIPFHNEMERILGKSIFELTEEERGNVQFVLTGGYTDIRILDTARKLRNDYAFSNVLVCPHLVGSANQDGHIHALKSGFPDALVSVIPSLEQMAILSGVRQEVLNVHLYSSCQIVPEDLEESLSTEERTILERLFLFFDSVQLQTLSGGWSGSRLYISDGTKRGGKTQSEIVKIDSHEQMHRELMGYYLVKDFLGKHVPTFSTPVTEGESTGVKMELASMQGSPETFQSIFEGIDDEAELELFLEKLQTALDILSKRLYKNTKKNKEVRVIESLGFNKAREQRIIAESIDSLLGAGSSSEDVLKISEDVSVSNPTSSYGVLLNDELITKTDVCLAHRDLNLANIIGDAVNNTWFIDWVSAGEYMMETDFAKLENDVKFIISKNFKEKDLPNLYKLERFMLQVFDLPEVNQLSPELSFVKEDLRFKKVYSSVQLIRKKLKAAKESENFDLYKLILLRSSRPTIGYNVNEGKGECDIPQLKYALLSTSLIVNDLTS